MRFAFTLIELLVVMVILVVVMGMVIPEGSKMLNGFEKNINKVKLKQKVSKLQSESFLDVKEQNVTVFGLYYFISTKGVITKYEKSDDNN